MAVSPTLAEDLAAAVVQVYADTERVLLERMARSVAKGLNSPAWAEQQLFAVQSYRRQAEALLRQVETQAARTVDEAVTTAANRGTAAAAAELAEALGRPIPDLLTALPGRAALVRLVTETVGRVTSTHPRILRATMDAYRQVIADATGTVLLGAQTRREAAQQALDGFARRGVTGFVDRAGRSWELASYAEMATRTATTRAAVDAHTERLTAAGHDLVVVSDAPQECERCRVVEGKVLSLSGAVIGTVEREHAIADGRMVRVNVWGTLAEARAAGLYHPGCRHSHAVYLPGVTRPPTATADPAGDAARRRLRYLERQTRAAKRELAVSLDDDAARRARAKVAARQAAIRAHVATTSAKRQPQRERLGAR